MSQPLHGRDTMIILMCKRVELPVSVGRRILALAFEWSIINNQPFNMILVAQAISYAAKNKHLLKRNY